MTDRQLLLETAFHSLPEGMAIFDKNGEVAAWNAAAEAITGFSELELLGSAFPRGLQALTEQNEIHLVPQTASASSHPRGIHLRVRHKLGHDIALIHRNLPLIDDCGEFLGSTVIFHPAERLDALPNGETSEDRSIVADREEFESRLESEFDDFQHGGLPFGLLWISVDQGANLRRTHGAAACKAMIEKVHRALISGLRPAEELACWGEDEFVVLTHERTPEMLQRHALVLAGLARTADFRWWGDRISITVSIGAAQARLSQDLPELIENTRTAMETSARAGGNRVTCARYQNNLESGEEIICTPS